MYDIDNSFLKGVWYVGGESIAGANNDLKIVDGVINGTESNISKGSRSVVKLLFFFDTIVCRRVLALA